MKGWKWKGVLAALALTAVAAGGALAAGTQGSQTNPLVTRSYLEDVVVPEIMAQVEKKVDERIPQSSSGSSSGSQTAFQTVELVQGKKITVSAGTEVLFRSGVAALSSAMVDMTAGQEAGSMTANHLYLAVGDGQSITAAENCVLMVCGSYTIS